MRLSLSILAFVLLGVPAALASGFDVGVDARVVTRGVIERNLPSPGLLYDDAAGAWAPGSYLALREDRAFPLVWASASVSAALEPWVLGVVTLDPGMVTWAPEHVDTTTRAGLPATSTRTARRWRLDGLPPADALERGWMLREVYVELGLLPEQALEVTLGKQRWQVLEGWIYDDHGLGAAARLDLGALIDVPLALEARALLTHRYWEAALVDLPVFDARATVEWGPGDRVTGGVALCLDRAGFVPRLLTASSVEGLVEEGSFEQALVLSLAEPTGSSTLGWADAGLELAFDEVEVAVRGALQWGGASFRFPGGGVAAKKTREVKLPGAAAALDVAWHATHRLDLTGFAVWFSGGRGPSVRDKGNGSYGAFVSLVPFLPYTSLFFDGGMGANLATREAQLVGTSGRGVLGGGLGATLEAPRTLTWAVTLAALGSDAGAPFTNGRFYGVEADLGATWTVTRWLDAGAEVAVLTPGTFYRDERTLLRVTVGLDARY